VEEEGMGRCERNRPGVWTPKYRKRILVDEVAECAEHLLRQAAESYDMVIDTLEMEKDHVHVSF
jgi:REP element-mobilizing transposase RayT